MYSTRVKERWPVRYAQGNLQGDKLGGYNDSFVRRSDITYWFNEDALAAWKHANDVLKVGQPYIYSDTDIYSDTTIGCLLVPREMFRLPYRHTQGLAKALLTLMEANGLAMQNTEIFYATGQTPFERC